MINVLTGEPVSEETRNVLQRLSENESVPLEEIQELKEIKEAYSCMSNNVQTNDLTNRQGIRQGVYNKLQNMGSAVTSENGEVSFIGEIKHEKRLDIVIGLPASGKSSAIVEPLSEFYKSRVVDSDEAKKLLPEYNNGWGAGTVHKESQNISIKQLYDAMETGENIVYPRVGGDCRELKATIQDAKSNGYKIYVHFNELSVNKAAGRMMERFLNTGRFIKPELIYKYGNAINNTYEALKSEPGLIDGHSKWDNDVAMKQRPVNKLYSRSCREFYLYMKSSANAIKQDTIIEQNEKLKIANTNLGNTINEVNAVLKVNPKLCAEYKKARDSFRSLNNTEKKNVPKLITPHKKNGKKP